MSKGDTSRYYHPSKPEQQRQFEEMFFSYERRRVKAFYEAAAEKNRNMAWQSWLRLLANADDNTTNTPLPLFDTARDGGPWKGPSMKDWLRRFTRDGDPLDLNLKEDDHIEELIQQEYPQLKEMRDVRDRDDT